MAERFLPLQVFILGHFAMFRAQRHIISVVKSISHNAAAENLYSQRTLTPLFTLLLQDPIRAGSVYFKFILFALYKE
jgi:hypothetical protein